MPTTVTNQAQLAAAIQAADTLTSGTYTIVLGNAVTLASALPQVSLHSGVTLTIDGGAGDYAIDASGQRGLAVTSGGVILQNLAIDDAVAQGAAGASGGGGGGAGLGAGLFIGAAGTVTLNNVAFHNDSAIGGPGGGSVAGLTGSGGNTGTAGAAGAAGDAGSSPSGVYYAAGGAGGAGGSGGTGGNGGAGANGGDGGGGGAGGTGIYGIGAGGSGGNAGGGGLGGAAGNGGSPGSGGAPSGGNGLNGNSGASAGIGNLSSSGSGGGNGSFGGGGAGGGGGGGGAGGGGGGGGGGAGGGGGGHGAASVGVGFRPGDPGGLGGSPVGGGSGGSPGIGLSGGTGGTGGFGAGTGGDGSAGSGGAAGSGGQVGSAGGIGSNGQAGTDLPGPAPGAGGAGGPGGAGGNGGTGGAGGSGGASGAGGGGLGAGGAIFVQAGGSLIIQNGAIGGGSVTGGASGGAGASAGYGFGAALFAQGTNNLQFDPGSGQTVTIDGAIGDQSGSDPTNKWGAAGALGLTLNGAGTLALNAASTFSGGIQVAQGTLLLGAAGAYGSGTIGFSGAATLRIEPGAVPTIAIAGLASDTLALGSGVSAGTISGLGTQFTGFGHYAVDPGAAWTLTGANTLSGTATLGTGSTLTNVGTLADFARIAGGSIVNTGTMTGAVYGINLGYRTTNPEPGSTLTNTGLIAGGSNFGVNLYSGGFVANNGGTIAGSVGVRGRYGSSTVDNSGTITGTGGTAVQLNRYQHNRVIDRAGAVFNGVVNGGNNGSYVAYSTLELAAGGYGTLSGLGTQFVELGRVVVDGGANWTLTGSNTLAAGYVLTDQGALTDAGTLINRGMVTGTPLTLAPGAVLSNTSTITVSAPQNYRYAVVGLSGGPETVVNAGYIGGKAVVSYRGVTSTHTSGINLIGGGSIANLSGGTIVGSVHAGQQATIANAGLVAGGIAASGNASVVTNAASGTIQGPVALGTSGSFGNDGTVAGGAFYTVLMGQNGTVANGVHGVIAQTGTSFGRQRLTSSGIGLENGGTIANAGTIFSAGHYGVAGYGPVSLTNMSGGTISGTAIGVDFGIVYPSNHAASTVTNAGTIAGATAAVRFLAGYANRLIVDPGAVFSGLVDGGNTIGSTVVSTLELASGASAGTLTGLGSRYVDFAQIVIDAGAAWTLASDTIGAGYTVTDNGTLTGVGTLKNAGLVNGTGTLLLAGYLTNTGVITNAANAGIDLQTGGRLFNASGGTIAGAAYGVVVYGSGATVINAGNITGTSQAGVKLNAGSHISNASSGTISGGLDGVFAYSATVVNDGFIGGTNYYGVRLSGGGYVSNASGGTISGRVTGVVAYGRGTVVNAGVIAGSNGSGSTVASGVGLSSGGYVSNAFGGTISGAWYGVSVFNGLGTVINAGDVTASVQNGVLLNSGGTVSNASGGMIAGSSSGVIINLFPGVVVNAGDIIGTNASGVRFGAGGSVSNTSGATISGGTFGVLVYGQAGFVFNAGAIAGTSEYGVSLGFGGYVSNASGGTISGGVYGVSIRGNNFGKVIDASGGTIYGGRAGVFIYTTGSVINAGTIVAKYGRGVQLANGGFVSNASGGTISGGLDGILAYGLSATVVNAGEIFGTSQAGVLLRIGGSVSNASGGTISSATVGVLAYGPSTTIINAGKITGASQAGVLLSRSGGFVSNASSGTIDSGTNGVFAYSVLGTVFNAGTILGTNAHGVYLNVGGYVSNASGGAIISGNGTGVFIGGLGTVVNAGSIAGGTGDSVLLAAGFANRLVIDPGASFAGIARGGNTIGASVVSTLELASGASAGTLTGLGSHYVDFGNITIDSGAAWTLGGTNTLAAGYVLTDLGTLTLTGSLTNNGTIGGSGTLALAGSLSNTGLISLSSPGGVIGAPNMASTVANAGTIAGTTDAIKFASGVANRLIVEPGAVFIGTVSGGYAYRSGVDSTLELAAGTSGYLSGLAAHYTDFSRIAIDAGASWTLASGATLTRGGGGPIAAGMALTDAGTLVNAGTLTAGVTLAPGATLANTGTIAPSIFTPGLAVSGLAGGAATVANTGLIADNASGGFGVKLLGGGSIGNRYMRYYSVGQVLTNTSIGTITGYNGIYIAGGAGTVFNAGTLLGTGGGGAGYAVQLKAGGSVTNTQTGTIAGRYGILIAGGAGTVVNESAITGGSGAAIRLKTGGTVVNQYLNTFTFGPGGSGHSTNTGTISGSRGVYISGGLGTVVNDGVIAGTVGYAVYLSAGGSVANQRIVTTTPNNTRVTHTGTIAGVAILGGTGTVDNTGFIGGGAARVGVFVGDGSLTNESGATIAGSAAGVELHGNLTNRSAGVISASGSGSAGVYSFGGTVDNAGTIGGSLYSVEFVAGANNLLIAEDGAVFNGLVQGGNTAGGTGVSTLLLAATPLHHYTNTLSGLGTQFTGFQQITVAAQGFWTLAGSNTVAAGTTLADYGELTIGGTLTNAGRIVQNARVGYNDFTMLATAGPLANFGTIVSSNYDAVYFLGSNSVTNGTAGLISGHNRGLYFHDLSSTGAPTTVVNAGTILGNGGYGVQIQRYGSVTNQTGATIAGQSDGVILGQGTVVNAGTIAGAHDAVHFIGNGPNQLVVDPGAVFSGKVFANAPAANTMELASGASAGTLSGLGSEYTGFGHITIDSGASWTLTGTNMLVAGYTLTNAGTLSLVNAKLTGGGGIVNNGGIVIDPSSVTIASLTGVGTTTIEAASTLDVTGTVSSGETIAFGAGNAVLQIDPTQFSGQIDGFSNTDTIALNGFSNVTGAHFVNGNTLEIDLASGGPLDLTVTNTGGPLTTTSNSVTALCFLHDTLIRTPRGEAHVQNLQIGDTVTTWAGTVRPIAWIGMGRVLVQRGKRCDATPVLIRKGALADNVPFRDLRVTKGHSMYLDGVLIPAEFLVNHRSILWDDHAHVVEFYHIELETHDILIANGAAAESYRDDGNRYLFQNANPAWESSVRPSYAPVETGGATVDAVWSRLLNRAGARPGVPLTEEADAHLLVDGQRIDPMRRTDRSLAFRLPRRPDTVRLVSRSAVPAELGFSRDPRSLGLAVKLLVVLNGPRARAFDLATAAPREGFHAFEPDEAIRWTDGDALLPGDLFAGFEGPVDITVGVGGRTRYADLGEARDALAG